MLIFNYIVFLYNGIFSELLSEIAFNSFKISLISGSTKDYSALPELRFWHKTGSAKK